MSCAAAVSALFSSQTSQSVSAFITKMSSDFFVGSASPLNYFSNAIGSVGLAVAVILCSFYLCLSKDGVERFLKVVIPPDSADNTSGDTAADEAASAAELALEGEVAAAHSLFKKPE